MTGLAALLLVAASGRVLAPRYVQTLVPPWVPRARAVVALSGAVELLLGLALLRPSSRRRAAQLTTVLIATYLTSHLDAASRASSQQPRWLDRPAGTGVRLAVNIGYVAWSAHVAQTAARSPVPLDQGDGARWRRRTRKYRTLRIVLWAGNRVLRAALRAGLPAPAFAVLETVGRRSGLPRRTPVGNGLIGDTFWLIAAHGDQADFVRNIVDEPRVRVLVDQRWRTGVAVPMPHDDPEVRSRSHPYRWDAAVGRALATTPLTIRIDLEPERPQR